MPRAARKELDTRGMQTGQPTEIEIMTEGVSPPHVQETKIQVVDGPDCGDKADQLAFMEEPVLIIIHPSSDPNPEDPVPVWVNGRGGYIYRGVKTQLKRKYVERLARARADGFRQDLNNRDVREANKLHKSQMLRYPFSIVEDKNPKGGDWLQKIMAEA